MDSKAKRTLKGIAAVSLITVALCSIAYSARAFFPYPTNYVLRLKYLNGWQSFGFYGFNCSALITNAHNEPYRTEREIYSGDHGKLELIAELPNRHSIDESKLQPGDIAAFQGPQGHYTDGGWYLGHGIHVAAFLGPNDWIDGDSRRGHVSRHPLSAAPESDVWFEGKVRILRWKAAPEARWQFHSTNFTAWFVNMCCINDYRLKDEFAKL